MHCKITEKQRLSKWAVSLPDTDILQQCKINDSGNVYSTFLFLSLLHFFFFTKPGKPHAQSIRSSSYLKTIQASLPTGAPIGLLNGCQRRSCFVSHLAVWGEERRWRKSKKCLCGNKDHLSLVFSLLTAKRMSEACD